MFEKILIANRGEIAVRIARSARALGVATVAVYSDADARALHVQACDEALRIGAAAPHDSYLNGPALIQAALASGAEAIHPGYGFLSENAAFADSCEAAGLIFIGPSAATIRVLGLKDAAKALARRHHVPVTPGYFGDEQDAEALRRHAAEIGYPVLIKPTGGGGGRGMRRVERAAEFDAALAAARREAAASFGLDRVLIEKYISPARHVEVQVLADRHGQCVHLFDRDCSVQRRHQKLIEEAPAPGLAAERRQQMLATAVTLAQAAQYLGAGTVEFIVDAGGAFYFMEMNTRLQVEHPVTEMISGVDLVEWQLRVAAGEQLPPQNSFTCRGHAIEARLCAEDAEHGFVPSAGRLTLWSLPAPSARLRIDAGVRAGDEVTLYYDSLLAKLIVWEPTRAAALSSLQRALAACRIGGVITNVEYLNRVLGTPAFKAAELSTELLEHEAEHLADVPPSAAWVLAALAALPESSDESPWGDARAWRLNASALLPLRLRHGQQERDLTVYFHADGYQIESGTELNEVSARRGEHGWTVILDGHAFPAALWRVGADIHVDFQGRAHTFTLIDPLRHATGAALSDHGVRAPMPGRVVAVPVSAGAEVERGAALMVIEAMKMEHTLLAPAAGRVLALHFRVGDQVAAGDELVEFMPAANT